MRCLFLEGLSESERLELDAFDDRCRALFEALTRGARTSVSDVNRWLGELDPEFELLSIGDASGGVLSLEVRSADPAAKPRLGRLAQLAPRAVRVQTERAALPLERVSVSVERSTGHSLAGARVRAGFGRGHLLELVVLLPRATSARDEAALTAAESAVYALLGDQRADDWIGRIDVAPLPRGGPLRLVDADSSLEPTFPLSLLETTVDTAIRSLHDGMRAQSGSTSKHSNEWTLLEAEPDQESPASEQGDLLFASTRLPEMLKCFLEGAPFSSCRFSPSGERFCYLKYRHDGEGETRILERQALEDRLDAALGVDGLGSVVGNGIGTRHSYVDFACVDVPRALLVTRQLGQRLGLPRSSWILFCDSEWRREWVGIWEQTPAPGPA